MTISNYLTDEASAKRVVALVRRIASEAVSAWEGQKTFLPDSDYWKLPERLQKKVLEELHM